MERAYDMDAAWDFLAGRLGADMIPPDRRRNKRNDQGRQTLGTPDRETGRINEIVDGLAIDTRRIFLYGTSHGGQTAMAAAHLPRITNPDNPMNKDLPAGSSPYRYAAFLDYYGGCGLHGAYGGSGNKSEWTPYAPFLMLHGNMDDEAVFGGFVPVNDRATFEKTSCWSRINKARQHEAGQLIEAVIYENAYHSFDEVERKDFGDENDTGEGRANDWMAKIHANYAITIPFIEAVQRQLVFNEQRPLSELGFSPTLEAFTEIPYKPAVPPMIIRSAFGPATRLDGNGTGTFDLSGTIVDPFQLFEISWSIIAGNEDISIDENGRLVIPADVSSPLPLVVRAENSQGVSFFPAVYEDDALTFHQGFFARHRNLPLTARDNQLDLLELVTPMPGFEEYAIPDVALDSELPAGVRLEETRLVAEEGAALPADLSFTIRLPYIAVDAKLQSVSDGFVLAAANAAPKQCIAEECGGDPTDPGPIDPEPDPNDPGDENPGDENPGDGNPGDGNPGDGNPGDGNPGDGNPGDGNPGDGDPGDGDPGDGDPGDGDPGDDDPKDPPKKKKKGGGAAVWMLPFLPLLRRRKQH